MRLLAAMMFCLLLGSAGLAHAGLTKSQLDEAGIAVPEGAKLPLDAPFRTAAGRETTIGKALAGRPALLVFADYTCRTLCGTTIAMASDALAKSGLDARSDFRFLVIGMDPKDTPADARAMKAKYLETGMIGPETIFLLGTEESVATVTKAVGYSYVYDSEADQFAHPTGAFVIAPDGKVTQLLTAIGLSPETVRLALVDAGQGKIGGFADYVRLLCYCYDPLTGKYSSVILGWLRGLGFATVAGLAAGILLLSRKRRRQEAAGGTP